MADYVTVQHLHEIIERIGASADRIEQLHRQAAEAAHAAHEHPRHDGGQQEGGNP